MFRSTTQILSKLGKNAILSALSGIAAGIAASVFLIALAWTTDWRNAHPFVLLFLPLAGFFIGWAYHHYEHRYGDDASAGTNLILDEIHSPQKIIPLRMAPLVLVGTILTHLFGGSAGREGTAVQMGATLSDQIARFFSLTAPERQTLLVCGLGAGFGAAIGAPWAGAVFGMEVLNIGRLRLNTWFESIIASFFAYYTSVLCHAPHSFNRTIEIKNLGLLGLLIIPFAGILFGFTARGFIALTHLVEKIQNRFVHYPPLRPFIGGLVLVFFYWLESSYRYVGLGLPVIENVLFKTPASLRDPILKVAFTAITIGSGFKGGEFIPLVFIGATLGSALSLIVPVSFHLLAALGFAAVFAGAANTPIACTLMAAELFGPAILPYAFIACFASYYFSGHTGIYHGQKIEVAKHRRLQKFVRVLRGF